MIPISPTVHTMQRAAVSRCSRILHPSSRSQSRVLSFRASPPRLTGHDLPRVVGQSTIFENKWLRLKTIEYVDLNGVTRHWFGIERTTTHPTLSDVVATTPQTDDKCDAVVVVPLLKTSASPTEIVLIRQFRPAVGTWVLELPAGLVDGDEPPEVAACRELEEETGFLATRVVNIGPTIVNDQALTNGCCKMVVVDVQPQADRTQHLEPDEMIQVVLAPVDGLALWLTQWRHSKGDAIDARLYAYALGMQTMAHRDGNTPV